MTTLSLYLSYRFTFLPKVVDFFRNNWLFLLVAIVSLAFALWAGLHAPATSSTCGNDCFQDY